MKKFTVFCLAVCCIVISGNAAKSIIDTVNNPSPNLLDTGELTSWWINLDTGHTIDGLPKASVDTGTALIDSATRLLKIKMKKVAAVPPDDYPWVELMNYICDLTDTNFWGVTAVKVTYKSDVQLNVNFNQSDLSDAGENYRAELPIAADWSTVYIKFDTVPVTEPNIYTLRQADWVSPKRPWNPFLIDAIGFDHELPETGGEGTLELSNVIIWGHAMISTPIKNLIPMNKSKGYSAWVVNNNLIKFKVPETEMGKYNISLFNFSGKKIASFNKTFTKNGANEISLKNSRLSAGVYVVQITNKNRAAVTRISIK